jgi:predicted ATPase
MKHISDISGVGLKIANSKCFDEPQGFDGFPPVTLIVGRNNAGKSAILDLVQHACNPSHTPLIGRSGRDATVSLCFTVSRDLVNSLLDSRRIGSTTPLGQATARVCTSGPFATNLVGHIIDEDRLRNKRQEIADQVGMLLHQEIGNPFSRFAFRRLLSDRDIQPETPTADMRVGAKGENASALIHRVLHTAGLSERIIEVDLLDALNSVFEPDISFTRIQAKEQVNSQWEIYLGERDKGDIPLSATGSGVKTVLLVLLNVNVLPTIENKPLSSYLFGFEELENNLHPAVQRRLFQYLRELAIKHDTHFLITTHSSIVIDMFGRDNAAQILHISHDGSRATVAKVTTYSEGRNIIRDLDVRASDLLQSNVVFWLEGPSDRIYVNRWIELWSDEKLQENTHYQCVFYGGSVLATHSFEPPDSPLFDDDAVVDEMSQALQINPNIVVLMDSDKEFEDAPLKDRVQRVSTEVAASGGVAWVTDGREIENYIPRDTFASLFGAANTGPSSRFDSVFEYVESIGGGKFAQRKTEFAKRVCSGITLDGLQKSAELSRWLNRVCAQIADWNGRDFTPRLILAELSPASDMSPR